MSLGNWEDGASNEAKPEELPNFVTCKLRWTASCRIPMVPFAYFAEGVFYLLFIFLTCETWIARLEG